MLDIRDHGGPFGGVNRNKYKRWASGTYYLSNGANAIGVSGLSFAPNFVIAWSTSTPSSYVSYAARLDSVNINIFKDGSYIYFETGKLSLDGFLIRITNGTGPIGNFKWIAYE